MTRLEALKLARKHEGLEITALGSTKKCGDYWTNEGFYFLFDSGKLVDSYGIVDFRENIKELIKYDNNEWKLRNAKKVANTKIAKKVYGKNIIEETSEYLIVKDKK